MREHGDRPSTLRFFSILLRAMHVLRQELLNPTAHLVEPLSCLEIRKEIGQVAPHSLAVPIHHGQIGSDMRREIDLVDDKKSDRVIPGPPLRGILSPAATSIT